SREFHPDRVEAVSRVELAHTFDEVVERIEDLEGERPEVVFTDAREYAGRISYSKYRVELARPERSRPALVVFGTGWGISPDFLKRVDVVLDPVWGPEGPSGYNHLSVRAAAAII